MDHFSYLIDEQHRDLLVGVILLVLAGMQVLSGEALERFGKIVTRRGDPKRFWLDVVICVVGGLLAIGWHFYRRSN
jgi:hypothetical protein